MTETFIADNIYKTRIEISQRVGKNLAVCKYGKNFMLYHVPSGKTVQQWIKPFNTLQNCVQFGEKLIARFPCLDASEPQESANLNKESYSEFIKPWKG